MGCFSDSYQTGRDLDGITLIIPDMTLQLCAEFCNEYRFFGMQVGRQKRYESTKCKVQKRTQILM